MFKEQMNKIKSMILKKPEVKEGEGKTNKRKIENLAVFVVILIVTLIIINLIWGESPKTQKEPTSDPNKKLAVRRANYCH